METARTIESDRTTVAGSLVGKYLAQLKRDARGSTAVKYGPIIDRYAAWVGDRLLTGEIKARDVQHEYLATRFDEFVATHGREPSANTRRNEIQALRSWYAWLDQFGYLEDADGNP
ncbi:MAG TPA: hypothetical protein VGQ45_16840, partial [Gaiellales bacterium]|nr:hypothetical protein [Gaiellales bacterium]